MEERIASILGARRRVEIPLDQWREAAVLVPLFLKDGALHLLLTKRSDQVEHHKGEISFPGGVRDREDESLLATALRETWEEIGLPPSAVRVLGPLDDHLTYTRFRITPYVGMIPFPFSFRVSDREIERLIELPVDAVLRNPEMRAHKTGFLVQDHVTYSFPYAGDVIWGATARVIVNLLELVFGFRAPTVAEAE